MCKKNLDACRSGKDFVEYAEVHGADVRPAKGSHFVVKTEHGQCAVPVHNGDLGKGLRCNIFKTFLAIGLTVLTLIYLVGLL